MARSKGMLTFSGKVGDLIFTNKKGKNYVKTKSTKPLNLTEATRKSSSDFGEASRTGAKIRKAFKPLFDKFGSDTLINRLNKELVAVLKIVPNEFAGHKKMIQGNVGLLTAFPSYTIRKIDNLLNRLPLFTIFPKHLHIEMMEKLPDRTLLNPFKNATAGRIKLMVYNMDLNGTHDEIIPISPLTIYIDQPFDGAKLKVPLNLTGDRWVLVAIGLNYMNGESILNPQRAKAGAIIYSAIIKDGIEIPFVQHQTEPIKVEENWQGLGWDMG
jgi:hypothetical protein